MRLFLDYHKHQAELAGGDYTLGESDYSALQQKGVQYYQLSALCKSLPAVRLSRRIRDTERNLESFDFPNIMKMKHCLGSAAVHAFT